MTDMRATERLLEVIQDEGYRIVEGGRPYDPDHSRISGRILAAANELRRRGDTLVRADDLRMILEQIARTQGWDGGHDQEATTAALDRLENALGGKMR